MKIKRFSIGNQVATSWEKTKRREITATLPLQKGLIFFLSREDISPGIWLN